MPDLNSLISEFLNKTFEQVLDSSNAKDQIEEIIDEKLAGFQPEIDADDVEGLDEAIDSRVGAVLDGEFNRYLTSALANPNIQEAVQELVDECLRKAFAKLADPMTRTTPVPVGIVLNSEPGGPVPGTPIFQSSPTNNNDPTF